MKVQDSHRESYYRKYNQSFTHPKALSILGPAITWPSGSAVTPSVSSNGNVEKKSVVGSRIGTTRKLRAQAEPSLEDMCTICQKEQSPRQIGETYSHGLGV